MNELFVRYGDIYRASILGQQVYVVSSPEHCERILRWNWENYPRKGQVVKRISLLLGNGLISSNGEFWARQRRMMQPAFTKNAIAGLAGIIVAANAALLERWKDAARRGDPVNVTQDVSRMVLEITLRSIFGEDYDVVSPHFSTLTDEPERNLEFAQAFRPLGNVIRQIAARRRRDGTAATDFLGRLMLARDRDRGEPMTDAQLVAEVMTLIVAGHETTAGLLNWMWYLLARHDDAQQRLAREFEQHPWEAAPPLESFARYEYARRVIDEALRLYPPLWLMTRRAIDDDQLGSYHVPAGTEIYISPYLIQRSPSLWEAPERFDPDRLLPASGAQRHELALCPFGAGPRNCIGELMARVEIQTHLMMFVKELRLSYDPTRPAEITTGMNLLSKEDFIMHPQIVGTGAA
jgi:cytochrome P450